MSHASCKRIWEGTLGIAITPRKKRDGDYFWSFSFVRAFRRTRNSKWEYVQHFGQQHATTLGTLMSKAFHFMEQTDPAEFLERAMAETTSSRPDDEETAEPTLESRYAPAAPPGGRLTPFVPFQFGPGSCKSLPVPQRAIFGRGGTGGA